MLNKIPETMLSDFRKRSAYVLRRTLGEKSSEKERLFVIPENYFNIYTILFKQSVSELKITFAEINNLEEDNFRYIDLKKETDGDLNIEGFRPENNLAYFRSMGFLNEGINWEKVVPYSIQLIDFSSTDQYIDFWLKADFDSIENKLSKKQFELIKFNSNLLNRSSFGFKEMVNQVADSQFTGILNEILGAYNKGWFYVSASAIGGLIEMLLYKTAVNYGKDNFETQRDKITKKNYVKKMRELRNFTQKLDEKQQIHFDALDELTMDRDYLTRNAVSHYTSGFVNEREVESLFVALTNTYTRYFVPSKNYADSHPEHTLNHLTESDQ